MYSTQQYEKDRMARAKMSNAVVSAKDSREVSAALRGKSLSAGLELLRDVKEKKRAIRFTRYNQESAGHRRGMGPGRYPLKAAMAFETLLESVRANAEFKDLDPELLRIIHVKVDQASRPFRYGRHRGRQGKRAHIEVVVTEDDRLKEKKAKKKQGVSATKQKAESKPAEKKTESKAADAKAGAAASETKAESKSEQKSETKQESKSESKADEKKAEPKAESKAAEKKESKSAESDKKEQAATESKPAAESSSDDKNVESKDEPKKADEKAASEKKDETADTKKEGSQ